MANIKRRMERFLKKKSNNEESKFLARCEKSEYLAKKSDTISEYLLDQELGGNYIESDLEWEADSSGRYHKIEEEQYYDYDFDDDWDR